MGLRAILAPALGAFVLVGLLAVPAVATTDSLIAGDPSVLWVLEKHAVGKVDQSTGTTQSRIRFPGQSLQGITVDSINSRVWLYGQRRLTAYTGSGTPIGNFDLPKDAPNGRPSGFRVDGAAGNVWLALSDKLYRIGLDGLRNQPLQFSQSIRALALDTEHEQLWVATANALSIIDQRGTLIRQFPVRGNVSDMAFAPQLDQAWVASAGELRRYDGYGVQHFGKPLPSDGFAQGVSMAVDGASGLWLSDNRKLGHLGQDGRLDFAVVPFLASQSIVAMAANSQDQSVWVASRNQLRHYAANGKLLSDASADVQASDLIFADGFEVDIVPPVLTVSSPLNGALLNTLEPQFTLGYTDVGWGVAPATLALQVNGVGVALNCQTQPASAVCTPATLLPERTDTLQFTVQDKAGNTSAPVDLQLTLDVTPPAIPVAALIGLGQPGASALVTVAGQAGSVEAGATIIIINTRTGQTVTVTADAQGAFNTQITAVPADALSIQARDAAGNTSDPLEMTVGGSSDLPPDPASVASTPPPTGTQPFDSGIQFLYNGNPPIQSGVAPGTIVGKQVSVMSGLVSDQAAQPLSGVTITVLHHPELGYTLSRADGTFDIAVNGGGQLTLVYNKTGYLPVQRTLTAQWNNYYHVDDVTMTPLSTTVTSIDLTSSQPMQVARGTVQTDADGTRQATLLFPQGTTATITLADGTQKPLNTLDVRLTEYTVGPNGPVAMPGNLPATTAYTYALELSVDQALAQGVTVHGKEVAFNQPIPFYVDNFLNFPVGQAVPVGYYDADNAAWIPYANGRIIKILSIQNSLAVLDVDGAGSPATATELTALGITNAELAELAQLYAPGASLWRVALDHFSSWDCNWPYGPPSDAHGPDAPPPISPLDHQEDSDKDNHCPGCDVNAQQQSVGETIPVAGTPFSLHYQSDRAAGAAYHAVTIPLTGATVPASLQAVKLDIDIAGQHISKTFGTAINQSYTFTWDGHDGFGRPVYGQAQAQIRVAYSYSCTYYNGSNGFAQFGNQAQALGSRSRCLGFDFPRASVIELQSPASQDATAGNWSLSIDHILGPQTLLLGDGSLRHMTQAITTVAGNGLYGLSGDGGPAIDAEMGDPGGVATAPDGSLYIADEDNQRVRLVAPNGIISTVAGVGSIYDSNGLFGGDGGPATQAKLNEPYRIAIGPDGSIYIADSYNQRIRRVDPNGIISTVAGSGTTGYYDSGFSGDGGPATNAKLYFPTDVAIGPDGSLYIADSWNQRIRRVTPDGVINTVAGSGGAQDYLAGGFSGDGGPATQARLNMPEGVAIGPDGSIYIADSSNLRIRRVSPNGIISTVAGNGQYGFGGDGGPATQALLGRTGCIAVGPDGSLYICDASNYRVRRVSPTGIISTVAGNGQYGFGGDGGSATQAMLAEPLGLHIAPDGSLYIADSDVDNNRIRRVAAGGIATFANDGNRAIASKDGTLRYVFDGNGNIVRTENTTTGAALYSFQRDSGGRLLSVTDAYGNVTTIQRASDGTPSAIVAPDGESTALVVDTSGHLTGVTDPTGAAWSMTYTSDGLLTGFKDRSGATVVYTYDANGRLLTDAAPLGHGWNIARTELDTSKGDYQVAMTSGAGNTSTFALTHPDDATWIFKGTAPDATVTTRTVTEGTAQISYADGSSEQITQGPDPRFDMASPVIANDVVTTPAGLKYTLAETRTATVPSGNDATQPSQLTDAVAINGNTFTSVFAASNNTWTTTTPAKRTITTAINAQGQPSSVQVGNLAALQAQYDARGRLASLTRSADGTTRTSTLSYFASGAAAGYLQSATDPTGLTVNFQRDADGRVTQLTRPDGQQIGFAYDGEGRMTQLTAPGGSAHVFAYDGNGSRTSYTPPQVGANGSVTVYHYNADLQPTEVDRPDGTSVTLAYTNGKLTGLTAPVGTWQLGYSSTSGQLTSIAAPGGENLSYTYDGPLPTQLQWTGAVAGTVGFTWDNNFRVVGLNVDGTSLTYAYDADGLLTTAGAMTLTRAADFAGVTGTTLTNVVTANTYNGYGELASDSATVSGTALFSESLTRDLAGRITGNTMIEGGATNAYAYTYDTAGRLTGVSQNGATTLSYAYDANGNRASATAAGSTITASYDVQDRLTQYGSTTYAYNATGDLTGKTSTQGTTQYSYDALGSLRSVTLPNATQIEYLIDGQNRRVGKKINGTLTEGFLYRNQLNPVAQTDALGNVVELFVYGAKPNVPAYMVKGGTTYRIVSDYLGSVRLVVDASTGQIAQQLDYDAFGQVTSDTNPGFQPFGYAGGLYDPDTGLVRFGARDYDAQIGRWTTKDPILFGGGQVGLYEYANNSPLTYRDPTGHLLLEAGVGAVIGGIWGGISGLIHNESASEIFRDMAEDAAIGGLAGLTDGASLFEGSLAREGLGYASRAIINSGGEALKECANGERFSAINIAGAGIGSVLGDFSGDASAVISDSSDIAGRVGASVIGGDVGAGVTEAIQDASQNN